VPTDAQKQLGKARRVLQKVGSKVLDQVRHYTFYFPSPKTSYRPSSDEQLRDVLAGMSDRPCEMHLDHRGEHPVITLTFAGDVALALALAKHSTRMLPARSSRSQATAPSRSSTGLTRSSSPTSAPPAATSALRA
jgi:hypothetical protein